MGPVKAPIGGYPDVGSGFFSKQLPYSQWYDFNNAQRIQINFLERITFLVLAFTICATYFIKTAFVFMCCYCLARTLFSVGYAIKGPDGRFVGAMMELLITVGALVMIIWTPIALLVNA